MSKKEDRVYLKHIEDAIMKIERYTKDSKFEDFTENSLVQDGVIRQLQIIGEATKLISEEKRKKYSEVPWKDIAGMRDKLVHAYISVDLEAIWIVVEQDISILKKNVKLMLIEIEQ